MCPFGARSARVRRRESNPSVEQMQILVSKYKARPLFPEVWKNSNPAIQRLRETIEDSWDHDGEARLTAICIVERVHELDGLWERYKKSNSSVCNARDHHTNIMPNNTSCGGAATTASTECPLTDKEDSTAPQIKPQISFYINELYINCHQFENPQAEKNIAPASTAATAAAVVKNNNILSNQQAIAQIQPHQGRNPCMERNIMSEMGEESHPLLSLIHGSAKDAPVQTGHSAETFDDDDALVSSDPDFLMFSVGRPRQITHPPIQLHVQNYFHNTYDDVEPSIVQTKPQQKRNKKGLSKLSLQPWKKQKTQDPLLTTVSLKLKADINVEWGKEYDARLAAAAQDDMEE